MENRRPSGVEAWTRWSDGAFAHLRFHAFTHLLLVAGAAMLTVIQAPIDWSFLAWAAYVPFAMACSPRIPARRLMLAAMLVGFLYWLVNLYWIMPITLIGWTVMGLYLGLFWPLLAVAVRFCRAKGVPLFLALPVLVAGAERLHGFPMGGFYWRFLGHSQYENLAMIQIADLVGAAGVSFVIAMVNGSLADMTIFAFSRRFRERGTPTTPIGWISGGSGKRQLADGPSRDEAPSASSEDSACRCHPPLHSSRTPLPGLALTGLVVIGTILYGQWRLRQAEASAREGPLVASLQSNVPQSVKRSFSVSGQLFDELMVKSKAAVQAGAELIVWPETMVQGLLDPQLWPVLVGDLDEDKMFHQALCEHAKDTACLLVGAYGAEIMHDALGEPYLGRYNSAYFYHSDGTRDPGRYDKIHLVLFGEYIPFKRAFPWLFAQLARFLPEGYNADYSLEHGRNYTIFEMARPIRPEDPTSPMGGSVKAEGLGDGATALAEDHRQAALDDATRTDPQSDYRFAVIICYEDVIPYVGRNFALDGQGRKQIDWLVNISNDGWFVRFTKDPPRVIPSTELPQHAAICAFRAVENRLPILRSVNTGISCLIESTGRIRDGYLAASDGFPTEAMDRTGLTGWFLDRMPIDTRVTFYSRHGEWFATGCAAAFVAAAAWPIGAGLVRRRRQRRPPDRKRS